MTSNYLHVTLNTNSEALVGPDGPETVNPYPLIDATYKALVKAFPGCDVIVNGGDSDKVDTDLDYSDQSQAEQIQHNVWSAWIG